MKKKNIIYFITGLILFSSCVKEISIKTDNAEILPVINCIFSPDSVFKVSVSLPSSISDTGIRVINNAEVKIYDETSNVINLQYTGKNGIYKSSEKPVINVLYNLNVKVPGYAPVTAEDKIPEPAGIDNVEYFYDYDILNNDSIPMAKITFSDKGSENNFYDCIDFEINNDKRIYNYAYHGEFNPDNVLINEDYLDYHPYSFFFSDILFNGKKYTISLPFANSFYIYDNIEFRTVSKNYYLFRKYWTRHLYNQSNDQNIGNNLEDIDFVELLFSGNPVEMFTNIKNGYGIFAGYSCDVWYSSNN